VVVLQEVFETEFGANISGIVYAANLLVKLVDKRVIRGPDIEGSEFA
jgi:hypothetical protein